MFEGIVESKTHAHGARQIHVQRSLKVLNFKLRSAPLQNSRAIDKSRKHWHAGTQAVDGCLACDIQQHRFDPRLRMKSRKFFGGATSGNHAITGGGELST